MILPKGQQASLIVGSTVLKTAEHRQVQFDPVRGRRWVTTIGRPAGYRHHRHLRENPGHYQQRPRLSGDWKKNGESSSLILFGLVDNAPLVTRAATLAEFPHDAGPDALSKALKKTWL